MATLTALLYLGLLANISELAWAALTVHRFDCTFNADFVANGMCQLYKPKHSYTYISAGTTFIKPTENVWIRLKLLRKVKETYQMFSINVQYNVCRFGKTEVVNSVVQRILSSGFKKIKNLRCPFFGNITVSKIRFEMPLAQGFAPPSDYILNVHLTGTKQNLYLFEGNISYTVTAAF